MRFAEARAVPTIPASITTIQEAQDFLLKIPPEKFVAFVRQAYPGPANMYERQKILFNAGVRGPDLW